jgi:ribosomal-protein-alanine N-acetyltransferase
VGLHRLQADIRPENLRSQRLVERLGFRQEGLLRRYLDIDGDWRDHLSYALLAEDVPGGVLARWRARAAGSL